MLKKLRVDSNLSVRDIACYSGISSSTLYGIEGKDGMLLTSFLRLFSLYLQEKGYVFHYDRLLALISNSMHNNTTIRLQTTDEAPPDSTALLFLLEKV